MIFSNYFGSSRKERDAAVKSPDSLVDSGQKETASPLVSPSTTSSGSDENVQDGVKDIQAVSSVWSITHMVLAYVL